MGQGWIAAALPANEAQRVRTSLASGLLDEDARALCDELALHARLAVGSAMGGLTVILGDHQRLVGASGAAHDTLSRAVSFCAHAILDPAAILCVPDAALDARFAGNPRVRGEPWIRFYAGVPLVTDDGQALGALCVTDPQPRQGLTGREASLLRDIARAAMDLVHAPAPTARVAGAPAQPCPAAILPA